MLDQEAGEAFHSLHVFALEGDHWQVQATDLERCRLLLRMRFWAER